ncbi:hypothetical protein [Sulfitobacter sp. R18_1]|uniref:hypothetical protein n=1 Tax=Sulfitobacter sp. R18_1 TaxID=2821104 RepID=UPI001ADB48DD|nr:hypothetical protein [Sulfitobacter sp. R18_1]MBO9428465.1 hypothetical protein [Sulfitobacter sp. R18_1]
MRKAFLAALIGIAPTAVLADFDPEFGMRMGYAFNDLAVDVDLTKERGAASLEDPQLYLIHDNDGEYWGTPAVIASPSSGVCGLGYYAEPVNVEAEEVDVAVNEILNSRIDPFVDRYGNHLLNVDEQMVPLTAEAVVKEITTKGGFAIMSAAEKRPDVMASIIQGVYVKGVLEVSGGLMYANIQECVAEIYEES